MGKLFLIIRHKILFAAKTNKRALLIIKFSMIKNLISCIAAAAFIEQRRRALKRFLTLVARHPVLSQDEAVKFFLTAGGNDVATRIKDKFKNVSEEYTVHPQADAAEVSIIIIISCLFCIVLRMSTFLEVNFS